MIWDLFQGYEKAHGFYEVTRTNEKGKAEGRALTKLEPVTQDMWNVHLSGTGAGLGIIPLRADNTVLWAGLDIDVNNIDHAALEAKIKAAGLPLVVARSKSGGAHCYLFLKDFASAKQVRTAMEAWAAMLGHGGCEVFPKQTSRFNETQDIGNWLNMPYYNAAKTLRYGIKDGQPLSLEDFVAHAEEQRIDPDELEAIGAPPPDALFGDGPPCLQQLHMQGGFPEGTRNDGMYNVVVYLRKRYPDDWEAKAQEYNLKMSDPPLSIAELSAIVKSIKRKAYSFRCKQQPIAPHCQARACRARPFGVGETAESAGAPLIGDIVKYQGDPVLWFIDVHGTRMMLTTDELFNQNLFAKKMMDLTSRVMSPMNALRWRKFLDELLQKSTSVPVPEDASPLGQFKLLATQFMVGQAQATSKEELVHRFTPYRTGDGSIWFRSRGLLEYLNNHNFKIKSEHHVFQMLRDMGGEHKVVTIKGTKTNIWEVPEPVVANDDGPLPSFGGQEF